MQQVRGGALSMPLAAKRSLHSFTAESALYFCAPDLAYFYDFYHATLLSAVCAVIVCLSLRLFVCLFVCHKSTFYKDG